MFGLGYLKKKRVEKRKREVRVNYDNFIIYAKSFCASEYGYKANSIIEEAIRIKESVNENNYQTYQDIYNDMEKDYIYLCGTKQDLDLEYNHIINEPLLEDSDRVQIQRIYADATKHVDDMLEKVHQHIQECNPDNLKWNGAKDGK